MAVSFITSGFRAVNVAPTWPELFFGANAPNIIQWESDNVSPPIKASITDGVNTFENLYPNADGIFSFDLSIFGRAKLAAIGEQSLRGIPILWQLEENFVAPVQVTVNVEFEESIETEISDTYYFIPALRQPWTEKKASFFEEAVTEILTEQIIKGRALLPTDNAMRFPGYPLDISFIHFQFFGVDGMPYKLFKKSGLDVISFTDIPDVIEHEILSMQMNDVTTPFIEIYTPDTGNQYAVNRRINMHYRNGCGVYLRWLNSFGGWSYWLFDGENIEKWSTENRGVSQVFTPNPFQRGAIKALPKQAQKTISLSTAQLEDWMYKHLLDLQWSRNVFVWQRQKNEIIAGPDDAWLPVNVVSQRFTPEGGTIKECFIEIQPQADYMPQI